MNTADIANGLADLCRQGQSLQAIDQYYSTDIVSIEPSGSEAMPARMEGIEAIRAKNHWWGENHEVHSMQLDGPFIGDGQFALRYRLEATHKPSGRRFDMTEMALYTVKDGKIVQEEFYYNAPG